MGLDAEERGICRLHRFAQWLRGIQRVWWRGERIFAGIWVWEQLLEVHDRSHCCHPREVRVLLDHQNRVLMELRRPAVVAWGFVQNPSVTVE